MTADQGGTGAGRDHVAAGREALRQVQELVAAIRTLAGRLGRTSHDTRLEADHTGDTMERLADHLASAVQVTGAVQQDLDATTAIISKAAAATAEAHRQTGESRAALSELHAASVEVGRITATIGNVAKQTRLLALNATIEAARAGEYGRGFAVVASEIKALSAQTANSTSEIAAIMAGIEARIAAATEAMSRSVNEITAVVDELRLTNQRHSHSNREMTATVEQAADEARSGQTGAAGLKRIAADSDSLVGQLEQVTKDLDRRSHQLAQRIERSFTDFTTLTVFEWEGYFSKFTRAFEDHARSKGHEVRLAVLEAPGQGPVYIDGPDQLLARLAEGGIDVVSPTHSYYGMNDGRLFSLTAPLDLSRLSSWPAVLPSLQRATYASRDGRHHAVPLTGGSVTLGYNARLANRAPDSWACLIDPAHQGRIGLTSGQWEINVYIAALLAGLPFPDIYDPPAAYDRAIQDNLNRMVGNCGYFWGGIPEAGPMRQILYTPDYWLGIAAANAEGQDWRFAEPKEGQPVWFDCMAITRTAAADPQKAEAAYLLLDFMLSPEVQLRFLRDLGTSIVNVEAGRGLPREDIARYHIGDETFFRPERLFRPWSGPTRQRFATLWQNALKHRRPGV